MNPSFDTLGNPMYAGIYDRSFKIDIVEFRLQETGTFNDQFHRPYEAVIRNDALQSLSDRVNGSIHSSTIGRVHSELVAGMADGIINISSTPDKRASIVNGWGERRFRFTLTVSMKTGFAEEICYIQGYSEYFDISHGGNINPQMVFYINSYTTVARTLDPMNPNGGYIDRVKEARQVMNGRYGADDSANLYGSRPSDLFVGVQSSYMSQGLETALPVRDSRVNLYTQTFCNNRMNSVPSNALSSVINTWRTAQSMADFGVGRDDVYDRSIQSIRESSPMDNPFINLISSIQNDGFSASVFFTLETLLKVDPSVLSRTGYTPLEHQGMVSMAGMDQCNWGGSDKATQIAYLAASATSAIMQSCGMVTVHFHATNMTLTGESHATMTAPGLLYSTASAEATWNIFLTRFMNEVMPDLTVNNLIPVSLTVDADIYNETRILLTIDTGIEMPYIFPAFADSILQPTFTTSSTVYNGLVNGIEYVLNATGIDSNCFNSPIAEI